MSISPLVINSGYARSAGESAYPNLWRSLRGIWVPGIRAGGVGTDAVKDFSGFKKSRNDEWHNDS